ncbi:MAG: hypothetical protein ACE5HE_11880 [Phycisphaerae bacterium]
MRKTMLLACCLAACICVTDTGVIARGESRPADAKATDNTPYMPDLIDLYNDDQSAGLVPVPPGAKVVTHYAGGKQSQRAPAGAPPKLIYSNTGDPFQTFFYRPPLSLLRVGDDIFTDAVSECPISKYQIQVNGGVENGFFQRFDALVALTTYCPSTDYFGPTIPGTKFWFRDLMADIGTIHTLVIDFNDPNLGICSNDDGCRINAQDCGDGSECVARTEPVIIPSQVWIRVEFTTSTAGWIVGAPPVVGFSADQYDHLFTGCNTWFGGYPGHPHGSFWAQFFAPDSCPTHFLAYLAFDAQRPAYVDQAGSMLNQRLADDVELIVGSCELSTIELGTKGTRGQYEMDIDLRDDPRNSPRPGTERHWVSDSKSGRGNLEVARLEFDEGMFVPRNFWVTWKANKEDTGLVNAQRNQAGGECREPTGEACNRFFGWEGPPWAEVGQWHTRRTTPDSRDAVFYIAVYCRGETPRGPCCANQPDLPGQNPACIDDVPVTSCLGGRWRNSASDPARIHCPDTFFDGVCEDGLACNVLDQDCPDSACAAGQNCVCTPADDPWELIGQPACGTHACCKPDNNCEDLSRDDCVAIIDTDSGNPAKWNRGDFCGFNNQQCPFFSCFYGDVACTDCNDPLWPPEGCQDDRICQEEFGPDSKCKFPDRVCTIPKGCTNIFCCDWVCRQLGNQRCCTIGWDCQCKQIAQDCPGPPANDECSSPDPSLGAMRIPLNLVSETPPTYRGSMTSNHQAATNSANEPGICCNSRGTNEPAQGTLWYKFRAELTGSVRINTCNTPGQPDAKDSLVQVFKANFSDIGVCEDGTECSVSLQDCPDDACLAGVDCECFLDEERLCRTLEVIGCNDDGGPTCGQTGKNSDLCITNIEAGELYYIQVGGGSTLQQGSYRIEVQQPCREGTEPPALSFCEGADTAGASTPFDLTDTTLDCPAEPCVETMKNDVWFDHRPTCTGNLIVRTCDLDPQTAEDNTTLAVYEGAFCPPLEGTLLACNDDALATVQNHNLVGMAQTCLGIGNDCETSADCAPVCTIGHNACNVDTDCDIGRCSVSGDSCSVNLQDCADASTCVPNETCDPGVCVSACAPGAMVVVPVSDTLVYKIRVGGYLGSEPSGTLSITCEREDCNGNLIPDQIDLQDCRPGETWCADCNLNGVLDLCDVALDPDNWSDCQPNGIPDRCEIRQFCPGPDGPYYCQLDCDADINNNCVPDICDPICPAGAMDWAAADPPDGVIDGRQPNPLNDITTPLGIDSIVVDGPTGMNKGDICFTLCETRVDGQPNRVTRVEEGPAGTYTLTLERPLSAGAVTKITYNADDSTSSTGVFRSLPTDSNASARSEVVDITDMVACCLAGDCAPPYGSYSCDINHSGTVTAEDLVRLVDLLHGGDGYAAWRDEVPYDGGECP